MYVSFDDTDSTEGLCTTYLATEIIRRTDLDLIGYPRLVRLNPAVPWKTRGNGSLSLRLGRGSGKKIKIGKIGDQEIFCFQKEGPKEKNIADLMKSLVPIIEENREDSSDTGIVISEKKPSQSFYWNGVRSILDKQAVLDELERIGAVYHEFGNGRGLIGSVCGMAWRPRDSTYELIAYRPEERWGTDRMLEKESIKRMDQSYNSTFNSWEERSCKVSMVPGTPCPVMYGLRGDSVEDLPKAADMIFTEPLDRKLIFLTNQGTDDHIITDFNSLEPMRSYYIEGDVLSIKNLTGGHVVMKIKTSLGDLDCTAYEPSKEFRTAVGWLFSGDRIGVMGELRVEPRTVNIEKFKVIRTAKEFVKKSNPICHTCGRTMESVGKDKGYRCRSCKTSSSEAVFEENLRWIIPGWYEPPASSRRHLSKPLKRMGLEQPVDFVNRRI